MWECSAGQWESAPAIKDADGKITITGQWRAEPLFGAICSDFFKAD
jgi:hypothetical protein